MLTLWDGTHLDLDLGQSEDIGRCAQVTKNVGDGGLGTAGGKGTHGADHEIRDCSRAVRVWLGHVWAEIGNTGWCSEVGRGRVVETAGGVGWGLVGCRCRGVHSSGLDRGERWGWEGSVSLSVAHLNNSDLPANSFIDLQMEISW